MGRPVPAGEAPLYRQRTAGRHGQAARPAVGALWRWCQLAPAAASAARHGLHNANHALARDLLDCRAYLVLSGRRPGVRSAQEQVECSNLMPRKACTRRARALAATALAGRAHLRGAHVVAAAAEVCARMGRAADHQAAASDRRPAGSRLAARSTTQHGTQPRTIQAEQVGCAGVRDCTRPGGAEHLALGVTIPGRHLQVSDHRLDRAMAVCRTRGAGRSGLASLHAAVGG